MATSKDENKVQYRDAAAIEDYGRRPPGRTTDQGKPPLVQADACWDTQSGKDKWYGI